MLLWNTIKFAHVALGLVPEILDAINVIMLGREQLGMVDAVMLEIANIEHIIAAPAVRIDDTIWNHFALDDGYQRIAFSIRDNLRIHTATAL